MSEDPLDRLERTAERIVGRVEYEQANRLGLLWIHSIIGLLAGPQMLLWGSASTIEATVGVWSRSVLAALGFAGGLLLAIGLSRRPRVIRMEAAGLALVGLWDAAMTAGLIYARIHQDDYRVIPLGQALEPGYVVAYPSTVYAGLLALILVHLWTLRRLRKAVL